LRPGIAVKERNIPLHFAAKFGVNASIFRALQTAIRNIDIQPRMLGHAAENRRSILDDMIRDE
jgi:hypothetical protein